MTFEAKLVKAVRIEPQDYLDRPVIIQGIKITVLSSAILRGCNTKYLFEMTELTGTATYYSVEGKGLFYDVWRKSSQPRTETIVLVRQ